MSTADNESPDLMAQHVAGPLHSALVVDRRCQALVRTLCELIGNCCTTNDSLVGLDIGCGAGQIAKGVEAACLGVTMKGVDVIAWTEAQIEVTTYDGTTLPFKDKSFDFSVLIDVLHHTNNPLAVLKEAVRTTRQFILIKDHYCQNSFDSVTLSFMDWVGNKAHGVALPYNYQSRDQWQELFKASGLECEQIKEKLGLYPFPFSLLFERRLHFAARLAIK